MDGNSGYLTAVVQVVAGQTGDPLSSTYRFAKSKPSRASAALLMPSAPKHCSLYFVLPIVGIVAAIIAYRAALSAHKGNQLETILTVQTLAAVSLQQELIHELHGMFNAYYHRWYP
jgi:hypothetical protein